VTNLVLRRLLLAVPMLIGVSIVVFFLLRLVPGDPAAAVLGVNATPALEAQVRHDLGLDEPIYVQYGKWIGDIFHGNMGHDYTSSQAITDMLGQRLPVTIELAILALLIAVIGGVTIGVIAAVRQGGIIDSFARGLSVLGIAIPDFAFGLVLILGFALTFRIFPISGFVPLTQDFGQNLRSLILPAVALAAGFGSVLIRITRGAMLDVLADDFIRFGRAVGMSEWRVISRHALRNASVPIVTVIGLQVGGVLGATVIVEQVFSLPGIGALAVDSVLNRDYPVVQATLLVLAVMYVIASLGADVVATALNPKLRKAMA
jgi:peptide/nickel transport system permease protein